LKKILILENDVDTLDLVGYISEDNGFEVTKSTKMVPVKQIAELNPSLILIDYKLDDGFGNDLCLELKTTAATRHIPIILYSASYKIEQLAHDSYADAFIAKPFNLADFERVVNKLAL
jgi:DNA-binding response OmpR family regulator